jgi:hypothetical protein
MMVRKAAHPPHAIVPRLGIPAIRSSDASMEASSADGNLARTVLRSRAKCPGVGGPVESNCADGCDRGWGHVIRGKVTYKVGDREETIEAGEAYYVPAGHTPAIHAGTELVEFSPTADFQQTMETVTKNLEAAG